MIRSELFVSIAENILDHADRTVFAWGAYGNPISDTIIYKPVISGMLENKEGYSTKEYFSKKYVSINETDSSRLAARYDAISNPNNLGKFMFDCSGFVLACYNCFQEKSDDYEGGPIYKPTYRYRASDFVKRTKVYEYDENGYISNTPILSKESWIENGEFKLYPGEILWQLKSDKKRVDHVAIYLGNGRCVECAYNWNSNAKMVEGVQSFNLTDHYVEGKGIGSLRNTPNPTESNYRYWQGHGKLDLITYAEDITTISNNVNNRVDTTDKTIYENSASSYIEKASVNTEPETVEESTSSVEDAEINFSTDVRVRTDAGFRSRIDFIDFMRSLYSGDLSLRSDIERNLPRRFSESTNLVPVYSLITHESNGSTLGWNYPIGIIHFSDPEMYSVEYGLYNSITAGMQNFIHAMTGNLFYSQAKQERCSKHAIPILLGNRSSNSLLNDFIQVYSELFEVQDILSIKYNESLPLIFDYIGKINDDTSTAEFSSLAYHAPSNCIDDEFKDEIDKYGMQLKIRKENTDITSSLTASVFLDMDVDDQNNTKNTWTFSNKRPLFIYYIYYNKDLVEDERSLWAFVKSGPIQKNLDNTDESDNTDEKENNYCGWICLDPLFKLNGYEDGSLSDMITSNHIFDIYGIYPQNDTLINSNYSVAQYSDIENFTPARGSLYVDTDSDSVEQYYENLYTQMSSMSSSNISQYANTNCINGLPFSFLSTTDIRYMDGSSTAHYGSEYTKNILYDMPLAVIKPGIPSTASKASMSEILKAGMRMITSTGNDLKKWFLGQLSKWTSGINNSRYQRFYHFNSEYSTYVQYVNTICHLFVMFLGIGDRECELFLDADEKNFSSVYANYDDIMSKIDSSNSGLYQNLGSTPAVFCYYSPESTLNTTINTATEDSSVNQTINSYASKSRGLSYFAKAMNINIEASKIGSSLGDLVNTIGGMFGVNLSLGAETVNNIVSGHNMDLPQIWSDSRTTTENTFVMKLVSPYGDNESLFLHVLRPLARLMALALPRQSGANSYMMPFIVQAFSKGQFNIQLGIISNLSITRGGDSGASLSTNGIPTEINVRVVIDDMYSQLMASNEYSDNNELWAITKGVLTTLLTGNIVLGGAVGAGTAFASLKKSIALTLNNIGLMDFVASYSGYNLNTTDSDMKLSYIYNTLRSRLKDFLELSDPWQIFSPNFSRKITDSYSDLVARSQTFITT